MKHGIDVLVTNVSGKPERFCFTPVSARAIDYCRDSVVIPQHCRLGMHSFSAERLAAMPLLISLTEEGFACWHESLGLFTCYDEESDASHWIKDEHDTALPTQHFGLS